MGFVALFVALPLCHSHLVPLCRRRRPLTTQRNTLQSEHQTPSLPSTTQPTRQHPGGGTSGTFFGEPGGVPCRRRMSPIAERERELAGPVSRGRVRAAEADRLGRFGGSWEPVGRGKEASWGLVDRGSKTACKGGFDSGAWLHGGRICIAVDPLPCRNRSRPRSAGRGMAPGGVATKPIHQRTPPLLLYTPWSLFPFPGSLGALFGLRLRRLVTQAPRIVSRRAGVRPRLRCTVGTEPVVWRRGVGLGSVLGAGQGLRSAEGIRFGGTPAASGSTSFRWYAFGVPRFVDERWRGHTHRGVRHLPLALGGDARAIGWRRGCLIGRRGRGLVLGWRWEGVFRQARPWALRLPLWARISPTCPLCRFGPTFVRLGVRGGLRGSPRRLSGPLRELLGVPEGIPPRRHLRGRFRLRRRGRCSGGSGRVELGLEAARLLGGSLPGSTGLGGYLERRLALGRRILFRCGRGGVPRGFGRGLGRGTGPSQEALAAAQGSGVYGSVGHTRSAVPEK